VNWFYLCGLVNEVAQLRYYSNTSGFYYTTD